MDIIRPVFRKVFRKVFNEDEQQGNLETEDGFNLLQENGELILLEGN